MAETQVVKAALDGAGFSCVNEKGAQVKTGDGGPSPTDLLLMAVAGCGGIVLKAVLDKKGFAVSRVDVAVEGEKAHHPRRFSRLKVHFDLVCRGLTSEVVEEALVVTERACPVVQTLSAEVAMTFSLTDGGTRDEAAHDRD